MHVTPAGWITNYKLGLCARLRLMLLITSSKVAGVCMCMCIFVGSWLANKVFIGNLPAMGKGWVIIKPMMNRGQLLTDQLHDINWGALNHASCAPHLMSCNYCVCVHTCVCMHVCIYVCVEAAWCSGCSLVLQTQV